ncbi:MAG: hypothetical protein MIO92_13415 [Methanosarcinaceae archaeon]|nr:hypothetical protein [Methanosarcinaceae archaeon]
MKKFNHTHQRREQTRAVEMREFWFESEGTPLFAVEDGEGPALVMPHGALADHRAALPLITPLSSRYRIIAPDLYAANIRNCTEVASSADATETRGAFCDRHVRAT